MADKVITTDVLVLGGGLAGCMAAIRAREQGAKVTLVDKAAIERSGDGGRGVFFYSSYFNSGETWDTAERYRQWWRDVRHGMVDMRVVDELVIKNQPVVQQYVENSLGVSLKDPRTGRHSRLSRDTLRRAIEHPRFFFMGESLKTALAKRVEELGAEVVERIEVTRLLTDDGRVIGAAGFHNRSGDFYTFKAKAVVLALGSGNRVYSMPNDNPFNTYRKPWNTGTGYVLASRAGADVASLEFVNPALATKCCNPGAVTAVLTEAGARLVNGLGQPVVERPDGPGEWGISAGIAYAAFREINAGRGPVYFDARKITREQIETSIKQQAQDRFYDMPMSVEYLERTGVDLAGGLIECTPILNTGNCSGGPKGVVVDEKCLSSVQGLYVAGDCSFASDAVSGALTTGYVAGFEAAKQVAGIRQVGQPDEVQVKEEKERVFAPLGRSSGTKWDELERGLRQTMMEHVGISRTELGIKSALSELQRAQEQADRELYASNLHELLRANEAMDTLAFDQLMAEAALERTESRCGFAMSHYRADYPKQDDAKWWGVAVVVKNEGEKIVASPKRMNPLQQ